MPARVSYFGVWRGLPIDEPIAVEDPPEDIHLYWEFTYHELVEMLLRFNEAELTAGNSASISEFFYGHPLTLSFEPDAPGTMVGSRVAVDNKPIELSTLAPPSGLIGWSYSRTDGQLEEPPEVEEEESWYMWQLTVSFGFSFDVSEAIYVCDDVYYVRFTCYAHIDYWQQSYYWNDTSEPPQYTFADDDIVDLLRYNSTATEDGGAWGVGPESIEVSFNGVSATVYREEDSPNGSFTADITEPFEVVVSSWLPYARDDGNPTWTAATGIIANNKF